MALGWQRLLCACSLLLCGAGSAAQPAAELSSADRYYPQPACERSCFKAFLRANPAAVPPSEGAAVSSALARIEVSASCVTSLEISWKLPGWCPANPVIGIHIHSGNFTSNGPILVGFCGEGALPSFGRPCSQGKGVLKWEAAATETLEGLPGLDEAAQLLIASKAPRKDFYVNLHTQSSFNFANDKLGLGPLGLIRGQLERTPCFRKSDLEGFPEHEPEPAP